MATKFYLCSTCGNLVVKLINSGVDLICCGFEMEELVPFTDDGKGEKHLPVIDTVDDNWIKVKVGTVAHPMAAGHYIVFIFLETEHGGQLHYLEPGSPAEVWFCISDDKPVAIYSYCNVHGLWKTELDLDCGRLTCF